MPRLNVPKNIFGFTLIEILVIILIVGILSAIAIPSFINVFDKINLNNTVAEVRTVLQQGQREAIRKSQICEIGLNNVERTVLNYCANDERKLTDKVVFATNIRKNPSNQKHPITIKFGVTGTASFTLEDLEEDETLTKAYHLKSKYLEMSFQPGSNSPKDPSGKIVFYIASNPNLSKKCIAISKTLGLTRIGKYTGKIKKNSQLSNKGICTAT